MFSSRRLVVLAALLAVASLNVQAQGTLMPQPSKPSPDAGDPRSRRAEVPDYRQYEYGKEIYAVKLGCKTCPLGDQVLDEATARRFFSDEALSSSLDDKEYAAVSTFLRERFALLQ